MDHVKTDAGPGSAEHTPQELIRLEVSLPGERAPKVLEFPAGDGVLDAVRHALGLSPDTLIFALDGDEPLTQAPPGRKALRLAAHKARQITVVVNYEHLAKQEDFPPSKTVFRVLQWAVSKKAYHLDPASAARANLILPGEDQPLPREASIGTFLAPGEHVLTVDLTLKDFTNGGR